MDDAALAREALDAFERLLADRPKEDHHARVTDAIRRVIALRDRLVERRRTGEAVGDRLDRANAIASLAFGAQFAVIGAGWEQAEKTRDALRAFVQEAWGMAEADGNRTHRPG